MNEVDTRHWHILQRRMEGGDPVFESVEVSTDKDEIYDRFQELHRLNPELYRFSLCTQTGPGHE